MVEAINQIKQWYQLYYGDGIFLVMAIVSYLYMFVHCKEIRVKFLYPIALIVFCIINPVLYKILFSGIIYWRLFWMIPDAIIIAAAVTGFVKNCSRNWEKMFVLAVVMVLILVKGTNVFLHGNFTKVQNWEKVSEATESVCDILLEQDDNPKGIFPSTLYCEVRQYAPEISMMYGRNAEGYIFYYDENKDAEYWDTCWQMEAESPDFDLIFSSAQMYGYNFVVVLEFKAADEAVANQYSYRELARTSGYVIYYNDQIET